MKRGIPGSRAHSNLDPFLNNRGSRNSGYNFARPPRPNEIAAFAFPEAYRKFRKRRRNGIPKASI
jgi:hypothetical protein